LIEWLYGWLVEIWSTVSETYHPIWDTLDILLVACAIYWLLILIRGTRAAQMSLGLLILVLVWILSEQFQLATIGFVLGNFLSWGVLIVIVIFQADIRRALSRVGRGLFRGAARQEVQATEEVVRACQSLAQRRVGALIVLERETSLEDHLELGTRLDAELSRELLISVFLPYSPLHDGAVVIRGSRIAAAGCILPLALRANLPTTLGTRHRAALGIAEETDAIAIVVSEETGKITLAASHEVAEDLDAPRLRQALLRLMGSLRGSGRLKEEGRAEEVGVPVRSG
jgi:diadenylate cyclase